MRRERVRLLYCTGDFRYGGTQLTLLRTLERLDRTRFEVSVACLADEGELREPMAATGVPIMDLAIRRPLWHPASLARILTLSNRIRREVDVVHSLLGHANVIGLTAAAFARHHAVIASQRNYHPRYGSFRKANPLLVRTARLLFRHVAHRIVVNNVWVGEKLQQDGIPPDRIIHVPNGIDAERFQPASDRPKLRAALGVPPDAPVIGFAGRLISEKGCERLLVAAGMIQREVPGLHVVVLGNGPEEERLTNADFGVPVRFLGYRPDPEAVLPAFDVFGFPSTYSEGTPNTVLEAMACGLPSVVYRMPQTEAFLRNDDTALLVDRTRPDDLATALGALLEDPERRRAMGARAREEIVTHFSLDAMVAKLETLYLREARDRGSLASR